MKTLANASLITFLLVLSGCSTFGADKKLATSTAVQTAALKGELEKFRKYQAFVAQARLESIERTESLRNRLLLRAGLNDKLLAAAGETSHIQLRKKIDKLLIDIKKQNDQHQIEKAKLRKDLQSVVSVVSIPAKQLLKVQKGLTQLGREVSQADTLRYLAKFINEIKVETEKLQNNAEAKLVETDENIGADSN